MRYKVDEYLAFIRRCSKAKRPNKIYHITKKRIVALHCDIWIS